MSTRITDRDLEILVDRINAAAGMPRQPYTEVEGKLRPQAGNYHLYRAYGKTSLRQMSLTAHDTGSSPVPGCDLTTKRELYNSLQALLAGLASC